MSKCGGDLKSFPRRKAEWKMYIYARTHARAYTCIAKGNHHVVRENDRS